MSRIAPLKAFLILSRKNSTANQHHPQVSLAGIVPSADHNPPPPKTNRRKTHSLFPLPGVGTASGRVFLIFRGKTSALIDKLRVQRPFPGCTALFNQFSGVNSGKKLDNCGQYQLNFIKFSQNYNLFLICLKISLSDLKKIHNFDHIQPPSPTRVHNFERLKCVVHVL